MPTLHEARLRYAVYYNETTKNMSELYLRDGEAVAQSLSLFDIE